MPIKIDCNAELKTLFVEVSGVVNWDERKGAAASYRECFKSGKVDYALFDLRGLTGENNAKEERDFGQLMVDKISEFKHVRAAAVLSRDFLVSSLVVLVLQQSGFNIMDFWNIDEAKAWLYSV